MYRRRSFAFFLVILVSLLAGCSQFQSGLIPRSENLDDKLRMGKYVPKIDNFFILLDASSSMSVPYEDEQWGVVKFKAAKDFIRRMNNTMPGMNINGSLLVFGRGIELLTRQTEVVYGPTAYSRSGLEQCLNSLSFPAEGNSPAGPAIKAISEAIGSARGDNAVILISDGEHLGGDPHGRVRILEDLYGERTCFYTVWVGNNPEGKSLLDALAGEVECGLSVSANEIVTEESMIDFVKQVFLTTNIGRKKETSLDEDSDSDGDGVPDSMDRCPDTPVGAFVDDRGCWVIKGVQFEYKKWAVKPQFYSNLDNIENILKKNPGLNIRIEGHTDDIGSMKYNIDLSSKRAKAIKDYLAGKGIDPLRITTAGLGFAQPIADNDTPEGRALNRRAEIIPIK